MEKIKSILLNNEISFLKMKNKKNIFNIFTQKSKSIPSKLLFKKRKNNISEKYISYYTSKSPFRVFLKKDLKQIDLNLINEEDKTQPKTERFYPTSLPEMSSINIESPLSNKNYNYYKNKNKILNNYNSRKNSAVSTIKKKILENSRNNLKNDLNTINSLEKIQNFVNLSHLFGKRKKKNLNKLDTMKFHVESMKLRKEYADLILKNSLLSFHKSQNSAFAHNLNSNYMIEEFEKSKFETIKLKKIYLKNEEEYEKAKKMEEELNDVIDTDFVEFEDAKKKLKRFIYISQEINFNEDENYLLFKKYENRINYIYDKYHVPKFKNHFLKYNKNIDKEIKYINELDCPNVIDYNSWAYLNIKKAKIQNLLDKGSIDQIEEEKNDTKNEFIKTLEKKIKININKKNMDNNDTKNNKKIKKEKKLSQKVKDYFHIKTVIKINPDIASNKLKEVIYNKFSK